MAPRREYTKNELRHKHAQEKAKAEKRKLQLEKQHVTVKRVRTQPPKDSTHQMSTTQAGKLVAWYREIDFNKTTWHKTREVLSAKVAEESPKMDDTVSFDSVESALEELYKIGERLADQVSEIACKPHRNDDDELHWCKKILVEGALNDKANAASVLLRSCPFLATRQLDQILKHNYAVNRTEHSMGLAAFLEIWRDKFFVPHDVELEVFTTPLDNSELKQDFKISKLARKHFIKRRKDKYYLQRVDDLTVDCHTSRLLVALVFEHQLVQLGVSILKLLQKRASDAVEFTRHESFRAAMDMMTSPTLRETATRLTLRYFADSSGGLTNRLNLELGKLLLSRPDLKLYVCSRVHQTVWMQKVDILELSRRDALSSIDGRIKSRDSKAISLARKANSAKKEIAGIIDKDDKQILRKEKNMNTAHNTVCRALKFLADVSYVASEEDLISAQLINYLALLQKIMTPTKAPRIDRVQQKQIKFVRKNKLGKDADSEILMGAASKVQGELVQYVVGLGHSIVGSGAMRFLLLGLKRLIPYCSDTLMTSLAASQSLGGDLKADGHSESHNTKDIESKHTPEEESAPGQESRGKTSSPSVPVKEQTLLFRLGSEIMKVAHQIPCYATRVHAWTLCYSIYKRSKQEHFIFANLYAQLKDFRYMQTRSKNAWLRLNMAIVTETRRCPATIRAAFLRRLYSVLSLLDLEGAPLPLLMILRDLLKEDQTALGEWIGECLGIRANSGLLDDQSYDFRTFAPERADAMQSSFWEFSLAKCSLLPSISTAYENLTVEMKALESRNPTGQSVDSLRWGELMVQTNEDESSDESVEITATKLPSQIYKLAQRSQSMQVLYRLLQGQTLRVAVKDRASTNAKTAGVGDKDGSEESDLDIIKSVWDYDIYDENLWRSTRATDFLFPFRNFVEAAFKHTARPRQGFKDFDDEVDKFADSWIETQ